MFFQSLIVFSNALHNDQTTVFILSIIL